MLRRKPTRLEMTQADLDELDAFRRETDAKRSADTAAASGAAPVPSTAATRRNAAVAGQSARDRLGLPSSAPGAAHDSLRS